MKGHLRQRSPGSFELKVDIGKGADGKRIVEYRTFRGTKRQAQGELAKLIVALGRGEHVAKSALTVGEHVADRIEQWVALKQITPKTAERYRELLRYQIAPYIGGVMLQALKAPDIERWHGALLTSGRKDGQGGLSKLTIRHAHRLLSKALKQAQLHELTIRNVASIQPPPKVTRDEVTILTAEQVHGVVHKLAHRVIYLKTLIALFTGMRRGEILALRWERVDLERKIIKVCEALEETQNGKVLRFKKPKSEAGSRDISLPDLLVEKLRDLRRQQLEQRVALGLGKLRDDALLFPRLDGRPSSPLTLSKEWAKAAASIGLDGVTFHSLRHTHVSALIDAGIDVVKISKRIGHASPTTTLNVYAHLFARREDKTAGAINDAMAALVTV